MQFFVFFFIIFSITTLVHSSVLVNTTTLDDLISFYLSNLKNQQIIVEQTNFILFYTIKNDTLKQELHEHLSLLSDFPSKYEEKFNLFMKNQPECYRPAWSSSHYYLHCDDYHNFRAAFNDLQSHLGELIPYITMIVKYYQEMDTTVPFLEEIWLNYSSYWEIPSSVRFLQLLPVSENQKKILLQTYLTNNHVHPKKLYFHFLEEQDESIIPNLSTFLDVLEMNNHTNCVLWFINNANQTIPLMERLSTDQFCKLIEDGCFDSRHFHAKFFDKMLPCIVKIHQIPKLVEIVFYAETAGTSFNQREKFQLVSDIWFKESPLSLLLNLTQFLQYHYYKEVDYLVLNQIYQQFVGQFFGVGTTPTEPVSFSDTNQQLWKKVLSNATVASNSSLVIFDSEETKYQDLIDLIPKECLLSILPPITNDHKGLKLFAKLMAWERANNLKLEFRMPLHFYNLMYLMRSNRPDRFSLSRKILSDFEFYDWSSFVDFFPSTHHQIEISTLGFIYGTFDTIIHADNSVIVAFRKGDFYVLDRTGFLIWHKFCFQCESSDLVYHQRMIFDFSDPDEILIWSVETQYLIAQVQTPYRIYKMMPFHNHTWIVFDFYSTMEIRFIEFVFDESQSPPVFIRDTTESRHHLQLYHNYHHRILGNNLLWFRQNIWSFQISPLQLWSLTENRFILDQDHEFKDKEQSTFLTEKSLIIIQEESIHYFHNSLKRSSSYIPISKQFQNWHPYSIAEFPNQTVLLLFWQNETLKVFLWRYFVDFVQLFETAFDEFTQCNNLLKMKYNDSHDVVFDSRTLSFSDPQQKVSTLKMIGCVKNLL